MRAGNRSWGRDHEEYHLFTGLVFFMEKTSMVIMASLFSVVFLEQGSRFSYRYKRRNRVTRLLKSGSYFAMGMWLVLGLILAITSSSMLSVELKGMFFCMVTLVHFIALVGPAVLNIKLSTPGKVQTVKRTDTENVSHQVQQDSKQTQ